FSSRRRHTRSKRDWSSDVCSSDLERGSKGRFGDFEQVHATNRFGDCFSSERSFFDRITSGCLPEPLDLQSISVVAAAEPSEDKATKCLLLAAESWQIDVPGLGCQEQTFRDRKST